MTNEQKILVMAESDARFDGYKDGLIHLSRVNRDRYIDRASRSYYAMKQSVHQSLKSKLKLENENDAY